MERVFLVFGYGVPADIFRDTEYRAYLGNAFNRIFEWARDHEEEKIQIIFAGGKTDLVAPYRRSEAGEMKRYFRSLCQRDGVRSEAGHWRLLTDSASLSTLENLINCRKIMEKEGLPLDRVGVFCEFTRRKRITRLAHLLFGSRLQPGVCPVDFSLGANRYLSRDYIAAKEKKALAFDLWALESEENLKRYHRNFVEKFAFLRSYGPERKQEALRAWWENGGDERVRSEAKGKR